MVQPFKVIFNALISSVVRTTSSVTVNWNGQSSQFDWIIFTNKYNYGEADFIDLRPEEVDIFSKVISVDIQIYMMNAPSGTWDGLDTAWLYPMDTLGPYWTPASTWLYGCLNNLRVRLPIGATSPSDTRLCGQIYYNSTPGTVLDSVADAQMDGWLTQMSSLPITPANYTYVTRVRTKWYYAHFTSVAFSQGYLWNLWDLQGTYRSWYLGAVPAGFETVGDAVDFAKQLVDTFVERPPDAPPVAPPTTAPVAAPIDAPVTAPDVPAPVDPCTCSDSSTLWALPHLLVVLLLTFFM